MEVSTSGCKIQTQLIKKVGFQGEVLYRKYSHLNLIKHQEYFIKIKFS